MNGTWSSEHAMALRRSIREAQSAGPATSILLNSLHASLAFGDPELETVWDEETSPEQATLDLHLEGDGVQGHSTRADQLALFVSGINDAVKAIVRKRTGLQRLHRNLLVEGVQPGSVRVQLRADAPIPKGAVEHEASLPELERFASSPDSEALRLVARLFTEASDETPEIDADVQLLSIQARRGLSKALRAVEKGRWELGGSLSQRGLGKSRVELTARGAQTLSMSLASHDYETSFEPVVGTIDGFRRSVGRLYFSPAGGGQPFTVSVSSDDLIRRVAELAADPEQPVLANIHRVMLLGEHTTGRTEGRLLLSIGPVPNTPPFDEMSEL